MTIVSFDTMVFGLVGAEGPQGPTVMADVACQLGMGLQLTMHKGWNLQSMSGIPVDMVVSSQELFISSPLLRRYFDPVPEAWKNYGFIPRNFPSAYHIGYSLCKNKYIHAVPALGHAESWEQMETLVRSLGVAGVVMDTCHTLCPSQGLSALVRDPNDFVQKCDRLLELNVPWMLHFQPSRFPRNGKNLVVSNMYEIFSFLRRDAGNPLGEMLSPLRGVPNVPIVIELDPKIGFFLRRSGMMWLLRRLRDSILQVIK